MICGGCGVINGCACYKTGGKPTIEMYLHLREFERQMEALVVSGKLSRELADASLKAQGIVPAHERGSQPVEPVAPPAPSAAPSAKKFTPPAHKKSVAQMNETEKANAKRIADARAIAAQVAKEQKELIEATIPKPPTSGKWDGLLPQVQPPIIKDDDQGKTVEESQTAHGTVTPPEKVVVVDTTGLTKPTIAVVPVANTGILDLQANLKKLYDGLAARGETEACILLHSAQATITEMQGDAAIIDAIIGSLKDAELVLFANKLGANQGNFIKRWRKWKNEHGVGQVAKAPQAKEEGT